VLSAGQKSPNFPLNQLQIDRFIVESAGQKREVKDSKDNSEYKKPRRSGAFCFIKPKILIELN
jgi:hypothetical protein